MKIETWLKKKQALLHYLHVFITLYAALKAYYVKFRMRLISYVEVKRFESDYTCSGDASKLVKYITNCGI